MVEAHTITSPAAACFRPGSGVTHPSVRMLYGGNSGYLFFHGSSHVNALVQSEGGEQSDPLMPELLALGIHRALQAGHSIIRPRDDFGRCIHHVPSRKGRLEFSCKRAALAVHANIDLHRGRPRVSGGLQHGRATRFCRPWSPPAWTRWSDCLRDLLANNAAVQRVQTVDERLMYVDLQIHGRSFRMISVYLPQAGFAEDVLMQMDDSSQCMTSMEPQGAVRSAKVSTCKVGFANVFTNIGFLPAILDVFQRIGGLDVRCHAYSLEGGNAGGFATPGVRHLKIYARMKSWDDWLACVQQSHDECNEFAAFAQQSDKVVHL